MADAISVPKGGLDYGGGELCRFTLGRTCVIVPKPSEP